jgi:hypothetical protein
MFESGANPHPAQAVYHAFIDQSDAFVAIYWPSRANRRGTRVQDAPRNPPLRVRTAREPRRHDEPPGKYLLGVLERASAQHGSRDWARRLLNSEFSSLLAVLSWAADHERPSGELLRRVGEVWVWLLVRGYLRRASALSTRIESWPAAGLRGGRDTTALQFPVKFICSVRSGL